MREVGYPQRPTKQPRAVRCSPRSVEIRRVLAPIDTGARQWVGLLGLWLRGLAVQARWVAQRIPRLSATALRSARDAAILVPIRSTAPRLEVSLLVSEFGVGFGSAIPVGTLGRCILPRAPGPEPDQRRKGQAPQRTARRKAAHPQSPLTTEDERRTLIRGVHHMVEVVHRPALGPVQNGDGLCFASWRKLG